MKKYISFQQEQSEIIKSHGAFFAFNQTQFDQNKVQGVKYIQTSYGLIIPKRQVEAFGKAMSELCEKAKIWELENNDTKTIIWHALSNHEAQYGGIDQAIQHCEAYGILKEQVMNEYRQYMGYCAENEMI